MLECGKRVIRHERMKNYRAQGGPHKVGTGQRKRRGGDIGSEIVVNTEK